MSTKDNLNKLAVILLKWWTTPVFRYGVKNGKAYAEIFPALNEEESVDERIRKIDEARNNLVSALSAIDELKAEAAVSKREAHELQEKVASLSSEKVAVDTEIHEIRKIMDLDVNVFQRVAGVPSRKQVAKERLIGFGLGILASLIATLVWEKWPMIEAWF